MKKPYESPEIEIVRYNFVGDVIMASTVNEGYASDGVDTEDGDDYTFAVVPQ